MKPTLLPNLATPSTITSNQRAPSLPLRNQSTVTLPMFYNSKLKGVTPSSRMNSNDFDSTKKNSPCAFHYTSKLKVIETMQQSLQTASIESTCNHLHQPSTRKMLQYKENRRTNTEIVARTFTRHLGGEREGKKIKFVISERVSPALDVKYQT